MDVCFILSSLGKSSRICGVCRSIMLLHWWILWYGWHNFTVICNWIMGAEEGGRDDEEYQSFCLLSEVICGSTESAVMKVHLFTAESFVGKFTFLETAGLKQRGVHPQHRNVNILWMNLRQCLSSQRLLKPNPEGFLGVTLLSQIYSVLSPLLTKVELLLWVHLYIVPFFNILQFYNKDTENVESFPHLYK